MTVKEMQHALKVYQIEKDRVKRLEKAVQDITRGNHDRQFHIDVSEIAPVSTNSAQKSGAHTMHIGPTWAVMQYHSYSSPSPKRDTELQKLLGASISDMDALEIFILLLNKRIEVVRKMETRLRASGLEV